MKVQIAALKDLDNAIGRKIIGWEAIPNPIRWWHVLLWKSPGFTVTFTLEELNDNARIEKTQREVEGPPRRIENDCCGKGCCSFVPEMPEDV